VGYQTVAITCGADQSEKLNVERRVAPDRPEAPKETVGKGAPSTLDKFLAMVIFVQVAIAPIT